MLFVFALKNCIYNTKQKRSGSRGGDGSEPLLASSVPDLQLHFLSIHVNGSDLEVHTNGCDVCPCAHQEKEQSKGGRGTTPMAVMYVPVHNRRKNRVREGGELHQWL